MKELRGSASAVVDAGPGECAGLLLDLERYPSWYPEVIRQVVAVCSVDDTAPRLARTTVHLGVGPLQRDFDLLIEIASEARDVVRLTRVPHDEGDAEELSITWRIEDRQPCRGTRLTVALSARLDVPRLLPLGGVGDAVAQGFASAAARALAQD